MEIQSFTVYAPGDYKFNCNLSRKLDNKLHYSTPTWRGTRPSATISMFEHNIWTILHNLMTTMMKQKAWMRKGHRVISQSNVKCTSDVIVNWIAGETGEIYVIAEERMEIIVPVIYFETRTDRGDDDIRCTSSSSCSTLIWHHFSIKATLNIGFNKCMKLILCLSVCLSLSPLLFEYEIAHEESISPSTGNILQGQPLEFSLKNHFQCIYLSKYGWSDLRRTFLGSPSLIITLYQREFHWKLDKCGHKNSSVIFKNETLIYSPRRFFFFNRKNQIHLRKHLPPSIDFWEWNTIWEIPQNDLFQSAQIPQSIDTIPAYLLELI